MLYKINKVEILDKSLNSLALENFSSNLIVGDNIYALTKEISNYSSNNIIKLNLNRINRDTLTDIYDGWVYWSVGEFIVSISIDILEPREIESISDIL